MARHFQLWDTRTGNLIDTFATQGEALIFVRDVVTAEGDGVIDGWRLVGAMIKGMERQSPRARSSRIWP